jgi:hypothetical protein
MAFIGSAPFEMGTNRVMQDHTFKPVRILDKIKCWQLLQFLVTTQKIENFCNSTCNLRMGGMLANHPVSLFIQRPLCFKKVSSGLGGCHTNNCPNFDHTIQNFESFEQIMVHRI